VEYIVNKLNQKLVGWANYFSVGAVRQAYAVVNYWPRRCQGE
jgi:hypothetical protein